MSDYFTDREFGARLRTSEEIDDRLWGGFLSLIETRLDDGGFGYRFPLACPDVTSNAWGTDRQAFSRSLEAEVPWITWPFQGGPTPSTPIVLDLLEFSASAVGKPIERSYHDYARHSHFIWNRAEGLERFVGEVNVMFARSGVGFELDPKGKARRVLPDHIGHTLIQAHFRTGDPVTDALLETARSRFLAPKEEDRRDGLEKLWDAFERIKTLEAMDKRASAEALLDKAARPGSLFRQALADEALTLTRIGNTHRIRHSELSQEPLETSAQVDFLFGRLFALVHLLLGSRSPTGPYR